jgi:hypothetical protein
MGGDQECDVRREQGQRDLDARVARPSSQAEAQPTNANPKGDFAYHNQGERSGGLPEREDAGTRRGNGKAVKN